MSGKQVSHTSRKRYLGIRVKFIDKISGTNYSGCKNSRSIDKDN